MPRPSGVQCQRTHWLTERAVRETDRIIHEAVKQFYTPVTVNSHPISFATYSQPLIEQNWKTATELGVKIISGDQWLDWTEARESVTVIHGGNTLTVTSKQPIDAVTILLPGGCSAIGATTEVLWKFRYQVLTFRNMAAGECRTIALFATG